MLGARARNSLRLPSLSGCPRRTIQVSCGTSARTANLQTISVNYQGLLLDQFGVLHNGQQAYPAAIDAVSRCAEQGLKLTIISNSSRRAEGTLGRLSSLGFLPACFSGVVTSGELTHRHLAARPTPFWEALGSRCLHITWSTRGTVNLDGLQLQVTANPNLAEFVLVHGTEALATETGVAKAASMEELVAALQICATRNLTMIVANPDLVTVDGGDLVVMPGTLAAAYSRMGGKVQLMGKPDPIIYGAVAEMLQLPAKQLLAVGDSLEHDIAGAAAAGVDTLFIMGGIHAAELQLQPSSGLFDNDAFASLCDRFGVMPTYVMPYLQW